MPAFQLGDIIDYINNYGQPTVGIVTEFIQSTSVYEEEKLKARVWWVDDCEFTEEPLEPRDSAIRIGPNHWKIEPLY